MYHRKNGWAVSRRGKYGNIGGSLVQIELSARDGKAGLYRMPAR
ncbi:MAG: hypothetical protein ACLVLH_08775 [Eisenbergiella massiliensis]